MADTQTENYDLTLIENGGSPDTWGVKINSNWVMVDAIIKAVSDAAALVQTNLSTFIETVAATYSTKVQTAAAIAAAVPMGMVVAYAFATAPAGWIMVGGRTIGNAASGGTERANADTEALFTALWTQYDNTALPIQTSAGVASIRGANAAADFAANKRLPTLDASGRVIAGWDSMSGVSRNTLTNQTGGVNGDVIGAKGGEEGHTLLVAGMPLHGHPYRMALDNAGDNTTSAGGIVCDTVTQGNFTYTGVPDATQGHQIGGTGGNLAHNNVQPTIVLPFIMKL